MHAYTIYSVSYPDGSVEMFTQDELEVALAKARARKGRVYEEVVRRVRLEIFETFEDHQVAAPEMEACPF